MSNSFFILPAFTLYTLHLTLYTLQTIVKKLQNTCIYQRKSVPLQRRFCKNILKTVQKHCKNTLKYKQNYCKNTLKYD